MPLLVLNLGGEMLYILNQRLEAQRTEKGKAKRVLHDVVTAMYSPRFLDELFKPQGVYADASVKQVFDKLAHASIMKLNDGSMTKLYSLMVMGFKFQTLNCTCPSQLRVVTQTHIDNIRAMCDRYVQLSAYDDLTLGDWLHCKQRICQFFKDRKIRVSIFLQNDLQNCDGELVLDGTGHMPKKCEPLGTVRFFKKDGTLAATKTVEHPLSGKCHVGPDYGLGRIIRLAGNMYVTKSHGSLSAAAKSSSPSSPPPAAAAAKGDSSPQSSSWPTRRATAKDELDLLTAIMDAPKGDDDDRGGAVVLDIFDDGSCFRGVDGLELPQQELLDGTAQRKSARDLMSDLDLDAKTSKHEDDDLLALMDKCH